MEDFINYLVFNKDRKCYYIGFSSKGLKKRKDEHYHYFPKIERKKFYYFIRKYGWKSFKWEVIKHYNTKEAMIQGEIDNIKFYKKKYPDWECLNTAKGGNGGDTFTGNPNKEEIRNKHRRYWTDKRKKEKSEWMKHFLSTPEGEKWRKEQNEWMRNFLSTPEGKKLAKERGKRLKGRFVGENNPMFGKCGEESPVWGKKHTKKTIEQIRQSVKEFYLTLDGEKNKKEKSERMKGKHLSEETKEKIRKTKKLYWENKKGE